MDRYMAQFFVLRNGKKGGKNKLKLVNQKAY